MEISIGENKLNNKNKFQTGKISKLLLLIIVGGFGYGAYIANQKGLITADNFSSLKSHVSAFTSTDDYSGYGVQLIATSQLNQAKALMNDFAKDGYSAFVLASKADGRTLYKVRLGPYDHKPEAVAIQDKVVRRYPNNPYVKSSLVIYK